MDNLPLVTLIGDSQENFYQLGLKDREDHSAILDHMNHLVKTPFERVDTTIRHLAKLVIKNSFNHLPDFKKKMAAYSEGLGIEENELTLSLLVPELLSFLSKWVPGVPTTVLGCSSYFTWDEKSNSPVHGRVLDFPLQGSYDQNERMVWSKLDNGPATLSFSCVGFPYPSITAMTDYGVSFGLHQKFTDTFNPKGTPIFEIIFNMLQNCGDLKSTLDFLKHQQSLTTWAFNMGFENGDVLSCDIMGKELAYVTDKVEPGKIVYFNNMLVDKKKHEDQKLFIPHGIHQYNQMRLDMANMKMSRLKKEKSLTSLQLIKDMGSFYPQRSKKSSNWKCDTVTASSVTICTMNPKAKEALYIPGPAPKFYTKEILKITNIFKGPKQKMMTSSKSKTKVQKLNGYRDMMHAQAHFDRQQYHEAYHHMQMAIDDFEGMPEKNIALFFFKVFQYVHEPHMKMRQKLLKDFLELKDNLPPYLNDHCLLFIYRLEKIVHGKSQISIEDIHHEMLKKVLSFEQKMPRLLFHKATSILMSPRVDTLDVIYAHLKAI